MAVALALMTSDDERRQALALSLLPTAKPHAAQPRYLLHPVPGIGTLLRLVLLDAIHASARFASGQDCVSYCRLVKWARASAGTRSGSAGKKIGNAHRTWACSAAAVRCRRKHPAGPQPLARLAHTPGKGQARTIRAHTLARAVYDRLTRTTALDRDKCVQGYRAQSGCAEGRTGQTRDAPASRPLNALFGCVYQRPGVPRPCIPAPLPLLGAPLWLW